jgi:hypothetical protein
LPTCKYHLPHNCLFILRKPRGINIDKHYLDSSANDICFFFLEFIFPFVVEVYYVSNDNCGYYPILLEDAIERAKELGISNVVVASTSGKTALVFLKAMKDTGLKLIVVTHVVGFRSPEYGNLTGQ